MHYYVKEGDSSDFIQGELIQKIRKQDKNLFIEYAIGDQLIILDADISAKKGEYKISKKGKFLSLIKEFSTFFNDESLKIFMNFQNESTFFIGCGTQPMCNEGWKIHISASSYADYMYKLETLIPEFNKYNICYKVLKPSMFGKLSQTQNGKFFTVYLSDLRKVPKLSLKALDCLFSGSSIPVMGEKQIGSAYFRYGCYRGYYILNPNNEYVKDIRGTYKPNWIPDVNWQEIFQL